MCGRNKPCRTPLTSGWRLLFLVKLSISLCSLGAKFSDGVALAKGVRQMQMLLEWWPALLRVVMLCLQRPLHNGKQSPPRSGHLRAMQA